MIAEYIIMYFLNTTCILKKSLFLVMTVGLFRTQLPEINVHVFSNARYSVFCLF